MKAIVERRFGDTKYGVIVEHGVQSFRFEYAGTKKECEWYAKMFHKALKAHDEERAK